MMIIVLGVGFIMLLFGFNFFVVFGLIGELIFKIVVCVVFFVFFMFGVMLLIVYVLVIFMMLLFDIYK